MQQTRQSLAGFARDRSGATSIEYALIASLIALVLVGSVTATGQALGGSWDSTTARIITALGG